jgi:hypothetical protein
MVSMPFCGLSTLHADIPYSGPAASVDTVVPPPATTAHAIASAFAYPIPAGPAVSSAISYAPMHASMHDLAPHAQAHVPAHNAMTSAAHVPTPADYEQWRSFKEKVRRAKLNRNFI